MKCRESWVRGGELMDKMHRRTSERERERLEGQTGKLERWRKGETERERDGQRNG